MRSAPHAPDPASRVAVFGRRDGVDYDGLATACRVPSQRRDDLVRDPERVLVSTDAASPQCRLDDVLRQQCCRELSCERFGNRRLARTGESAHHDHTVPGHGRMIARYGARSQAVHIASGRVRGEIWPSVLPQPQRFQGTPGGCPEPPVARLTQALGPKRIQRNLSFWVVPRTYVR